jgi:hypothetical protein
MPKSAMPKSDRRLRRLVVATMVAGALLAPACGGDSAEIAELICDCEKCNDRERSETEDVIDQNFDCAEVYGCEESAEILATCIINDGDCDADNNSFNYLADCSDEVLDFVACIDNASSSQAGPSCISGLQIPMPMP